MSKSLLTKLQQTADEALNSKSVEEGMKHLAKAFSLFSQETSSLQEAYVRLQQRFQTVNLELEKTNQKLREKINELDTIGNYLKSILENISQGIIFIDRDGIVTTINKEAQNILEIEEKTVLFNSFFCNSKII